MPKRPFSSAYPVGWGLRLVHYGSSFLSTDRSHSSSSSAVGEGVRVPFPTAIGYGANPGFGQGSSSVFAKFSSLLATEPFVKLSFKILILNYIKIFLHTSFWEKC